MNVRHSCWNVKQRNTNSEIYIAAITCLLYWTLFALVLYINTQYVTAVWHWNHGQNNQNIQELSDTRGCLKCKYDRSELKHHLTVMNRAAWEECIVLWPWFNYLQGNMTYKLYTPKQFYWTMASFHCVSQYSVFTCCDLMGQILYIK